MNRLKSKYLLIIIYLVFYSHSAALPVKPLSEQNRTRNVKDNLSLFQQKLDSVIKTVDCSVSVQIVSAAKYDLLYDFKPSIKMIPASITKMITAATAIQYLGAGYDFNTIVFTDDSVISDGVINGNLYIKGFGDPDFNSYNADELIKKINGKNIKEITGNIIYDESFLDDNYYGLSGYYQGDTRDYNWPYVCGLSFNKNKGNIKPSYEAADYIVSSLKALNVKVEGVIIPGTTPPSAKEVAKFSRPISEVLARMNKPSDNQSAITVFKVVGAVYKSVPGTLEKGSEAVIDFLTSIGVSRSEFEILEGSGLSRYNYVTSNVYIQMLKYMYDDERTFDIFYNSLAIGGVDGTLKDRMIGTESERNVHAKTGTLNGVTTLAGYAISRDSELMIFYIAMNGNFAMTNKVYRKKQDVICDLICRFSRKKNFQ